jgi:hypothetical protein
MASRRDSEQAVRGYSGAISSPAPRPSSYDDILVAHLIPGLGKITLAKLAPAEIQTFLNRRLEGELSPRRVQYIYAVMRCVLVTVEMWGMVSHNVAKLVDLPRVPKHEITPLTPEQARQLIDASVDDLTCRCASPRSGRACARVGCSICAGRTWTWRPVVYGSVTTSPTSRGR